MSIRDKTPSIPSWCQDDGKERSVKRCAKRSKHWVYQAKNEAERRKHKEAWLRENGLVDDEDEEGDDDHDQDDSDIAVDVFEV